MTVASFLFSSTSPLVNSDTATTELQPHGSISAKSLAWDFPYTLYTVQSSWYYGLPVTKHLHAFYLLGLVVGSLTQYMATITSLKRYDPSINGN